MNRDNYIKQPDPLYAMAFKDSVGRWLRRLFELDRYEFNRVVIDKEVMDNIIELAKQTYPKEFIAFLEGKARGGVMRISGLLYQEYEASRNATAARIDLPLTSSAVGSVHSHPGPGNLPSNTDMRFFSKHGVVHLIIRTPYRQEDVAAYDLRGRRIGFEIVD
jgi:proteasome lid subunit RPN8/RPN11